MKIILKTDRVSAAGLQVEGGVIEVSAEEARRMIASNQAEPFHETAMIAPTESAALTRAKPRKKSHA